DAGADVDDIGLCTTPETYFFTGERGYKAAAMVTASHNDKEYNGVKISREGALPVGGDSGLKELEALVHGATPPPAAKRGAVREMDVLGEYVAFHRAALPDLGGLDVVFDGSCGVGSLVAKPLYAASGAKTQWINDTPDGAFPAHRPNPLLPEAREQLSRTVRQCGADCGVMFDGDADRVAFVDETGAFVRPDLVTAFLAEPFLSSEPGAPVLCDIRTSRCVTDRIAALGGVPHLWKVGHSFAKVKLRELGAPVGGELAGHYYFRAFHNCDSAMMCASIMLGAVAAAKRRGSRLSALVKALDTRCNTGEVNFTVEDKQGAIDAFVDWVRRGEAPERILDFDGVRVDWRDAWACLRPSNTEPYLRLVAEADSAARLAGLLAGIKNSISRFES
ncbi:MAG: phosphomannomutase/phosphoglucomutase, partial [Kiritimatiellae bacterium]|nr:phosphomannomutase/phosphoglucomutase [Kiritimatiellia bacterium]